MNGKQRKTLGLLVAVFFAAPFMSHASLVYESGEGWPSYTKNGTGYGFVQDSLFYRYYAGQIFVAQDDFTSSGLYLETCSTLASTTPGMPEITVDIYERDTWTATSSIEYSTWTYLNTWGQTIPFCENDGVQEILLSGTPYFEDRTVSFVDGKTYLISIGSPDTHEDMLYTRTSPDSAAVSMCGTGNDLYCGGFGLVNSSGTFGLWMSFDGIATLDSLYGACRIATLPYFDIQQCLVNAAVFLFVPSDDTLDEWRGLSLASSTPFGYVYAIPGAFSSIYATTSATWQLTVDFSTLGQHADALRGIATSSITVFDACWLNRGVGEAGANTYQTYVMPVISALMWLGVLFGLWALATRIF